MIHTGNRILTPGDYEQSKKGRGDSKKGETKQEYGGRSNGGVGGWGQMCK